MDTVDTGETNQKRAKGYKGIGMEGPVARWYAKNTAKTLGEFQQCAHEIARHLPDGSPSPGSRSGAGLPGDRACKSWADIKFPVWISAGRLSKLPGKKLEPRLSMSTFSKVMWRICRTKMTHSISSSVARRLRIFPIPLEA